MIEIPVPEILAIEAPRLTPEPEEPGEATENLIPPTAPVPVDLPACIESSPAFILDPVASIAMMAALYCAGTFGGSITAILINAPGAPPAVATAFDGYPMAQQGKAGKALAIAAWSSFAGGTLASIYLLFLAPSLSKVSLSFRSPDYFALMILGLTAIAAFSSKGQFIKAMMMVVLGLMLASVGQDSLSDITRFTFNTMNLTDGISFVLVVMATFAMSEALTIILKHI